MAKKNTKKVVNKNQKKEYGYMYIGHLPHGFYEEEIKAYFAQFGRVVRVRIAHSKLTGNPKGYGFIQFDSKEVAQIAAETMNNYLMFNKLLKCHLIPKEKLHPETFKNAKKKFFKPLKSWFRKKYNKKRTEEQLKKMKERQADKMEKRQEKLKALGINLDFAQMLKPTEEPPKVEAKKTKRKIVAEVPAKNIKPTEEPPKVEAKKTKRKLVEEVPVPDKNVKKSKKTLKSNK